MGAGRPHVVIAGAGIGGLTAALALAQIGCRIDLLERAEALVEAGAGVQLSPNATRILKRLGLLERIFPAALAPEALRIRRGRDGQLLARVPLGRAAEARWGAPTLVVHRADLQRALLDAIAGMPCVAMTLGAAVAGYAETPDGVTVAADRGAAPVTVAGEILVGADGVHSRVRGRLVADPADRPVFAGRTAWRATIPAERLAPAFRARETNLWLGRRCHLVHYPLRDASVVNVVAIVEGGDGSAETSWSAEGEPVRLAHAFAGWCREARLLLDAAADWRIWPLFERPALSRWSHGRVTLLGDAAHPMLPYLAQGAAQAIEDASALAAAVAASPQSLAEALVAYERTRAGRATRVQRQSRRQGDIYHLSGPSGWARDIAMRGLGAERLIARYDWVYADRPSGPSRRR